MRRTNSMNHMKSIQKKKSTKCCHTPKNCFDKENGSFARKNHTVAYPKTNIFKYVYKNAEGKNHFAIDLKKKRSYRHIECKAERSKAKI